MRTPRRAPGTRLRRLAAMVLLPSLLGGVSLAISAIHRPAEEPAGALPGSTRVAIPSRSGTIQRVSRAPVQTETVPRGRDDDALGRELARLEARLSGHPNDYEALLLKGLLYFKSGRLQNALAQLNELTDRAPKFRLAHLVQGDLLLARAHTVRDLGGGPVAVHLDGEQQRIQQLREEARVRLRAYLDSLQRRMLPRPLLRLGRDVDTGIVVDKQTHRLFVYRRSGDDGLRLVRDFYVSTGKLGGNKNLRGDLRTPEGVYHVTRHIDDRRLPDKYGIGAFPVNYPNELDRRLGKTGDGIWLHGTSSKDYSRPPRDSEGCVVLANLDLEMASDYIEPGRTPVVISDGVEWLPPKRWQNLEREVRAALEQWRRDWESGDAGRYLSHYADGFWAPGYDLAGWRDYKRRVLAGKSWQEVEIDGLSVFGYPRSASADRAIVVAEFRQSYRSNNFSSAMDKRMYLVREDGAWRVLYEGPQ